MSEKRTDVMIIIEATIATIDATKMIDAMIKATTEVMTEETTIIIAIAGKTKRLID